MLLETKISKDDGYQKQQGLIIGAIHALYERITDNGFRNIDRVDRAKWHRHGVEFPGGGRLRRDLVCSFCICILTFCT